VFADVRSVVRAIEEGADGYLLKEADTPQIAAAIRTVLDGGAPISPAVASHILARVRAEQPRRPDHTPTLTARETEVLESLASGRSFKEVALQHAISLHTVGDHVKSIYRKLAVNSRGEAVYKAAQSGLIRLHR
jgi:DNA-binding NarL/FixJ family response regulator